jgi:hypothetical protein
MWFSPQKEFGSEHLVPIIIFSCFVHAITLFAFFLVESWGSSSVFKARNGASVVYHASKASAHYGQAGGQPTQPAPNASEEKVEKTKTQPIESEKKSLEKKVDKKIKQESKPAALAQKKEQPKAKAEIVPKFSELKKEFTKLKRDKKQEPAVQQPANKEVVQKKKEAALPPSVTEKAQLKSDEKPGQGDSGNVSSGPASANKIEFDAGEASWSSDGIIKEIAKHYRIPPGFDDHEPFTITIDIEEYKVVNISPHGKEPLVLYAAFKEALLRSTMPSKRVKNKTIVVTK